MKCQILFSGKTKKNIINLSSAEMAQRVGKVKYYPLSVVLFVFFFLNAIMNIDVFKFNAILFFQ